jgi:phenylpyruvate tautomerase PptA (4-oxalocrotonate tautomerase family)
MPIVTVEVVVEAGGSIAPDLARALANGVGRVFGSPPGQTWVRLHTLDKTRYAENDSSLEASELPVFVTVLKREPLSGHALETEVASLTEAIARAVGRPPASVHLEYAPEAVSRLAFGGKLVR